MELSLRAADWPPRQTHEPGAWSKLKKSAGMAIRAAAFVVALPLLSSFGCGSAGLRPQPTKPDMPANAEKGHQAPKFTFKTLSEAYLMVGQMHRAEGSEMTDADAPIPEYVNFLKTRTIGLQTRIFDRSGAISMEWMTEDYLGSVIYNRFNKSRPLAVYDPADFLNGRYIPGTNIVTINPHAGFFLIHSFCARADSALRFRNTFLTESHEGVPGFEAEDAECKVPQVGEADLREMIAHELLHYASFLGGGFSMHWENGLGGYESQEIASFLHEGLTELHAQQLVRKHGYSPSDVNYPYQTATAFYLQKLAGERALRDAFLHGDFSEVMAKVDKRLGNGAFDDIMTEVNEAGRILELESEPLCFFTNRMKAAGIDYLGWARRDDVMKAVSAVYQASVDSLRCPSPDNCDCEPF